MNNRRRVVRALEICLLVGTPMSEVVAGVGGPGRLGSAIPATGVLVFRDREELYVRINRRVEAMFERGVIEQVRTVGQTSATASQMIGLREIRELLEGRMSLPQCIAQIQQATRRYAKRQLTWFRHQTNFSPLNLSLLSHNEAMILLRKYLERSKASGLAQRG
jgi:tRNA dimethylallyltransferase